MRRIALSLVALLLFTTAGVAVAQDRGEGQRGGPGGRFDPAEMRQRMMDGIKERMGATDEEWEVIEPKLTAVMEAQRDARAGGMGMGRGGFGGGGERGPRGGAGGGDEQPSAVAQASTELRETLEDEAAKPEAIKSQLDALRKARAEAQEKLTTAQQDLQGLLTQRQEAMLVVAGMLE